MDESPCVLSRRSAAGVVEFGSGGGASARVGRRLLQGGRVGSFYSECYRSFVPDNLTALKAYHVVVPFHHALGACYEACVCRSCAQLLACGGVGLVPSGGSGTGWTERSSGVDPIEQELGNSIGAGIDPTEWELWNLNGVGADPTERGGSGT
ncbi:hypothetical protein BHM03_00009368 [Ensete ventricosum]|nr:hypothetical protein BHM03_00009368 [Ensete ventricosum]